MQMRIYNLKAHEKLFSSQKNSTGINVFLSDFVIEGESHFLEDKIRAITSHLT